MENIGTVQRNGILRDKKTSRKLALVQNFGNPYLCWFLSLIYEGFSFGCSNRGGRVSREMSERSDVHCSSDLSTLRQHMFFFITGPRRSASTCQILHIATNTVRRRSFHRLLAHPGHAQVISTRTCNVAPFPQFDALLCLRSVLLSMDESRVLSAFPGAVAEKRVRKRQSSQTDG
jgi:hypothetical protein